ncbi:MAG: hypothetical protein IH946_05700, partial [Bacteroidetes bacterium]|nr:hypothetical protein [Bacteroidota bacterium]
IFLSKRGYDEFPVYAPRWETTGNDVYGTSCPGMAALGDIRQLQLSERRKAQGIDKQVNPPLHGPAQLLNRPVSSLPGGLVVYDMTAGGGKLEPIYRVEPRVGDLSQNIDRDEARINESFYVGLFQAITNMEGIQPKNMLQLMQVKEESLLQRYWLTALYGSFLEFYQMKLLPCQILFRTVC